jgi:hypothetical protein
MQVTRHGGSVQRKQFNGRGPPKGHFDTIDRPDGIPVFLSTTSQNELIARLQHFVDHADRQPADSIWDLIKSVDDWQYQATS